MLKFYYNPAYKYTNRTIINLTGDSSYTEHDYENIDSPDTINGHIIYTLTAGENIPTYIYDTVSGWRWFVSGITQLRTGKYQISLLRDVISESPNTWKQEQAYITAGTATDYNKYKRWDLPYTNTKIKEERLNINGKSSFFVFYVNEQHENSGTITESDLQINYSNIPGIETYDYVLDSISELPNYNLLNAGDLYFWDTLSANIGIYVIKDGEAQIYQFKVSDSSNTISRDWYRELFGHYLTTSKINYSDLVNNVNNCRTSTSTAIRNFTNTYQDSLGSKITSTQINSLESYVGKIIYDSTTNKIYTINLTTNTQTLNRIGTPATLYSALQNISWPNNGSITGSNNGSTNPGWWYKCNSSYTTYSYVLEEITPSSSFNFNFKASVRKLPKSAVRCVNIVSDNNYSDDEIAQCLMLAQTNGINADNTTGRILDVQYLPFSIATTTNSNLKINNTSLTARFLYLDDYQYTTDLTDLTDINKETDTIKIVSPSRGSQMLFRPYDNDGNMKFDSKITLKPYSSTIYVRPSTEGLLKFDWDDKDCLIIQEDFSLTNVTSEWTQYVYQNKTYASVFERQMQGRAYERTWERQVELAQAKSDEWTARNISSQKWSTWTGNIPVISGIAGAIGSSKLDDNYMRAAQVDRQYNEALYQESMNISRDLFNYQLENIKSQPLIPSKVTVIDCKFLDGVYLEYYSTNETELSAIQSFYYYNGNRIDDYGTFEDYWGNFIRGKIIISNNYTQPEIDELNRRLSLGIFTGGIT